ncbi:MAG: hypothetical protein Unbinned5081contig1003_21 [Prokaryotic dsDNA virus sp.]|nr:MAG: hypothetical protein Unbinned5081contig1003_21 [Prokaryotic dsDNA virus sp.]|tara:strand:- start:5049 stop:5252 length:204 start_codon:yes stop_codon:yes gene_type:complete
MKALNFKFAENILTREELLYLVYLINKGIPCSSPAIIRIGTTSKVIFRFDEGNMQFEIKCEKLIETG